jgi:hypothetical protein
MIFVNTKLKAKEMGLTKFKRYRIRKAIKGNKAFLKFFWGGGNWSLCSLFSKNIMP